MCTSLATSDSIRRDTGMPGPAGHDLRHVLVVDLLLEEGAVGLELLEAGLLLLHEPLEFGDLAVAQLCGALEVGVALGALGLAMGALESLLGAADGVDRLLLALPVRLHLVRALAQVGQLALDRLAAGDAGVVLLLLERLELDLELLDPALDLVDLLRHRVDLDPQPRRGLVDQVDRLVGQEAVGDVALRERGGGDDRRVLDAHAVMHLVALLEPAQDRDRVLHARLADHDRLEPPLERGVLLDVLAVLVERRRADGAQLAAGEHRLEQVGGVHRALGGAGADDRVKLVHEQDDLALGLGDLLQHGLQAILELAAVLGARDQRADVERDHAPVAQRLGHVPGDDPLGEPLGDGGLADAGLADQHRVVLRAARQHLDHPANLVVAADHRVELAVLGRLGEVAPEPLERLVAVLGVLVGHAVRPANLLHGLGELLARGAHDRPADRPRGRAAGARSRRTRRPSRGRPRRPSAAARSARTRARGRPRRDRSASAARRVPGSLAVRTASGSAFAAPEHGHDDAAVLLEQRGEQVVLDHLRVAAGARQALGGGEGLLGLDCESICLHKKSKSRTLRSASTLAAARGPRLRRFRGVAGGPRWRPTARGSCGGSPRQGGRAADPGSRSPRSAPLGTRAAHS